MRLIVQESGDAERTVAPAETRPVNQSWRNQVRALGKLGFRHDIVDRAAGHRLLEAVQVISAGDAGIPGAVITQIEIIAGVKVNSFDTQEAGADRATVAEPEDA